MSAKFVVFLAALLAAAAADPSAVQVLQDIYHSCLRDFSLDCARPKAMAWIDLVSGKEQVRITEDLLVVKKSTPGDFEEQRAASDDIIERFEDFLQSHDVVAKVPQILRPDGPLGALVPRSLQPEDVRAPLAATGRSKVVKKVILPFLLGLKFKTAVLVPLALALIALKTWKALTLGLLSLVLTGALVLFKFSKPSVNYEVIHYPQHVEHHVEHPPVVAGWDQQGYGRQMSAQEMAYNAYLS